MLNGFEPDASHFKYLAAVDLIMRGSNLQIIQVQTIYR